MVLFQNALLGLLYCTLFLCTDSPAGSTDAVAHHVSFAQITWLFCCIVQLMDFRTRRKSGSPVHWTAWNGAPGFLCRWQWRGSYREQERQLPLPLEFG